MCCTLKSRRGPDRAAAVSEMEWTRDTLELRVEIDLATRLLNFGIHPRGLENAVASKFRNTVVWGAMHFKNTLCALLQC